MGFFSGLSDALFGGGGGGASTTQTTATTQTDARQVNTTTSNTDARSWIDSRNLADYSTSTSNSNNTDARSWIDSRNLSDNSSTNLSDSRQWIDSRNLSDNSSTSFSDSRNLGDYSTTSITSIDAGAVDLAKSIGNNAITSNSTNTSALFAAADKLFGMQQSALDANVSLAKSLAGTAQTAYSDAASTAQGNKPVLYGALAVMALIAASFFRKK